MKNERDELLQLLECVTEFAAEQLLVTKNILGTAGTCGKRPISSRNSPTPLR